MCNKDELKMTAELEQLHREYAELKSMLDKQEIANEQSLKASVRKKVGSLKRLYGKKWIHLALIPFVAATFYYMHVSLGMRLSFVIVSIAFYLGLVIWNFVSTPEVDMDAMLDLSIQDFVQEVKKKKQNQFKNFRLRFGLVFIWIAYLIGECIHASMGEMMLPFLIGAASGAVIGLCIAVRLHNRIIGIYEDVLADLSNLHE